MKCIKFLTNLSISFVLIKDFSLFCLLDIDNSTVPYYAN